MVIDLVNECDLAPYEHEILRRYRVHELLERIGRISHNGRRLLRGTSYSGGRVPDISVVGASDFVLMHGNGVREPERIALMAQWVRTLPTYKPMPVLITEDDHYDFDRSAIRDLTGKWRTSRLDTETCKTIRSLHIADGEFMIRLKIETKKRISSE